MSCQLHIKPVELFWITTNQKKVVSGFIWWKNSSPTHLTVDCQLWKVKLPNHAQRYGSATGLRIIQLPLEEDCVNTLLLGKDIRCAGTGRTTSNNLHLVLHVCGRWGWLGRAVSNRDRPDEGGWGKGRGNSSHGKRPLWCWTSYFQFWWWLWWTSDNICDLVRVREKTKCYFSRRISRLIEEARACHTHK